MSQKLTLARYLEGRGSVKSLTRIEAEAFGVPYPLISGWPARHGDTEITQAMLADLHVRISSANRATANRAKCGLAGLSVLPAAHSQCHGADKPCLLAATSQTPHQSLNGFVLRRARRYGGRATATTGCKNHHTCFCSESK